MVDLEMRIAGDLKVKDWFAHKEKLNNEEGDENWRQAFDDYFLRRLDTRYFDPIETLKAPKDRIGEGFAMTALLCSLIEFLAATQKGLKYRHYNGKRPVPDQVKKDYKNKFEYYQSSNLFNDFLMNMLPCIPSKNKANEFYSNVRNPLFHEACTTGGWKIRAGEEKDFPIDLKNKRVNRDMLFEAIKVYLTEYRSKLLGCSKLQRRFIRKIDSICEG